MLVLNTGINIAYDAINIMIYYKGNEPILNNATIYCGFIPEFAIKLSSMPFQSPLGGQAYGSTFECY